jgi:hypothetical protein
MSSEEEALARNDAYLALVEGLGLCPFARRCRETGKLARRVLLGSEPLRAALEAVASIEALADAVEVGLLICPDFAGGHRAFEELCVAVRAQCHDYFCVAFHPELPEDVADEYRAVGFIRRSPDPTLQLVRRSVLERVRGEQGSTFVDASKMSLEELAALPAPVSVSDRIAKDNLATLRREGVACLRARLGALRPTK